MEKILKKKSVLINILSSVLFFGVFIASALAFWLSLGNTLFGMGTKLGLNVQLPVYYYILSCVFAISLVLLLVISYMFKSRLSVLYVVLYELLTIVTVICFAILATNPNETAYILTILMFTLFSPLFGFCYVTYIWSLFLIIPLFFASIIICFKVFKYYKEQKQLIKKSKKK